MIQVLRILFGCAISVLALTLTGCVFQRLTRGDIIGVWVERQGASSSKISATCGSFEFFSDGRFEAHNIPREYFLGYGVAPKRINASGTWELWTPPSDQFAKQRIELHFVTIDGYPIGYNGQVLVSSEFGIFGTVLLTQSLGDPDSGNLVSFQKRDKYECQ